MRWMAKGARPTVAGWYWVSPVETIGPAGDTSAIYFGMHRSRLCAFGWEIDLRKGNAEIDHLRFAGPINEPEHDA